MAQRILIKFGFENWSKKCVCMSNWAKCRTTVTTAQLQDLNVCLTREMFMVAKERLEQNL
jgi:hypothetical protein